MFAKEILRMKSGQEFCNIGVDHALEQVNITLKVMGGLKGITQRPKTLASYFLAASVLARLALEADTIADFSKEQSSHHSD